MTGLLRELVTLLVDTLRPRCVTCGRRRRACRFCAAVRCTCPAHMLAIGGYRRDCPLHETRATR